MEKLNKGFMALKYQEVQLRLIIYYLFYRANPREVSNLVNVLNTYSISPCKGKSCHFCFFPKNASESLELSRDAQGRLEEQYEMLNIWVLYCFLMDEDRNFIHNVMES